MKRNCNGCKALISYGHTCLCDLGFKNEMSNFTFKDGEFSYAFSPKEDCPKPKTRKRYHLEVLKHVVADDD